MHIKSFVAPLVGAAATLAMLPAFAQTKVTNQGVTPSEIVIGTHQDLSGPIKVWGVPVLNGMKLAVEEVNAKGGINGRKIWPDRRGSGLRSEEGRARQPEDGGEGQGLRHDRPDGFADGAGRAGHPVRGLACRSSSR